jgi:hypothetical protein
VAEAILDYLRMYSFPEKERGSAVAQIVETNRR